MFSFEGDAQEKLDRLDFRIICFVEDLSSVSVRKKRLDQAAGVGDP